MKNPETLRLLAKAATPGPWEHHRTHEPPGGGEPEVCAPGHDYVCSPSCDADGNYIAALDPPTVLALLARVAALEAALRRFVIGGTCGSVEHNAVQCSTSALPRAGWCDVCEALAVLAQPVGGGR